jgi:hypothetical protein
MREAKSQLTPNRKRVRKRLHSRSSQFHVVHGRCELNHDLAGEDGRPQMLLDDSVALSTLVLLETDTSTLHQPLVE